MDIYLTNYKDVILKKPFNYDVFVTHGGNFHADDVFSTALCLFLRELSCGREPNLHAPTFLTYNDKSVEYHNSIDGIKESIVRHSKRMMSDNFNDCPIVIRTITDNMDWYLDRYGFDKVKHIVYDIGRGKFDHHQNDVDVRPNGIKYASFGLIWREFGNTDEFPGVDKFIQKIDDHDNGGAVCEINNAFRFFNRPWCAEEGDNGYYTHETYFKRAVDTAYSIIYMMFVNMCATHHDFINNIIINESHVDEVDVPNENGTHNHYKFLVFKYKYVPWKSYVFNNNMNTDKNEHYTGAIYPHERGGYVCELISEGPNSMKSFYKFKPELCGLDKNKLPDGVEFVHKSGFLARFSSLGKAMTMAPELIITLENAQ